MCVYKKDAKYRVSTKKNKKKDSKYRASLQSNNQPLTSYLLPLTSKEPTPNASSDAQSAKHKSLTRGPMDS